MSADFKGPTYSVSYKDYLQIDKLLGSQEMESKKRGRSAHDEMLFIITHQTYELWFKQVLFEVDSIREIFSQNALAEEALGICVTRLERITRIQKVMIAQIEILETMSPMDFLDFRDLLFPASGFQSAQFRLIENKLGLKRKQRLAFDQQNYIARVDESEKKAVKGSEEESSLFDLMQTWLERTPFLQAKNFSFWKTYRDAVSEMLKSDEEGINRNPHLNEEAKKQQLTQLDKTRANFELIHDEKLLQKSIEAQQWRLSHKATLAALFIFLYRDEPALQLPYKVLSLLADIDENFTAWRYRHSQMALRMIGTKIGTGGSSGADYLQKSTQAHKVFDDLTRLATFLIPRRMLPALPKELKTKLAFQYQLDT